MSVLMALLGLAVLIFVLFSDWLFWIQDILPDEVKRALKKPFPMTFVPWVIGIGFSMIALIEKTKAAKEGALACIGFCLLCHAFCLLKVLPIRKSGRRLSRALKKEYP